MEFNYSRFLRCNSNPDSVHYIAYSFGFFDDSFWEVKMTVTHLKNILEELVDDGKGDYEIDFWEDDDNGDIHRHTVEEVGYRDSDKKVFI